jgi:hypothetical protein
MIEVQIFIPIAGNDGEKFGDDHHIAFEDFVLGLVGGLTLNPATATGSWQSGDKRYDDTLRIYTVAIESIADGDKIARIVRIAKVHYAQEAIFVRYLGIAEIL